MKQTECGKLIKRQKLTNGDSSSYVKTTNPSVIYNSKYNSYQINIRYRQGAKPKYVAKSTTGYSDKEDAEEDSNAWEMEVQINGQLINNADIEN